MGYFGGGFAPPTVTTVDRIDFSNETTSAPGNNLPQATERLAAVSSNSYGYFGGGYAPPIVNTIDRLDFSNETTSAPGDNLTQARSQLAAVSSSSFMVTLVVVTVTHPLLILTQQTVLISLLRLHHQ